MKATGILPAHPASIDETQLETWFERDRAWVALQTLDGETILEWWDEAVSEAIEDGFLNPRRYHESAYEYAESLRLVSSAQ
ncbi:MAG TPA: hypothetical protein VNE63_11275 [Candidatus Acidoferrales bacterium]|nr:hypothetical protein [Candidatus Acidoferrales bacterium]